MLPCQWIDLGTLVKMTFYTWRFTDQIIIYFNLQTFRFSNFISFVLKITTFVFSSFSINALSDIQSTLLISSIFFSTKLSFLSYSEGIHVCVIGRNSQPFQIIYRVCEKHWSVYTHYLELIRLASGFFLTDFPQFPNTEVFHLNSLSTRNQRIEIGFWLLLKISLCGH